MTEQIVNSFKDLIDEMPVDKITVSGICKKAGISRKTFYVYFIDKDDLVEQMLHEVIVKPTNELSDLLPTRELKSGPILMMEVFFQKVYESRTFLTKFISKGGEAQFQALFIEMMSSLCEKRLMSEDMPDLERRYFAYFHASTTAMLVIRWLKDKCPFSSKQMAHYYHDWAMRYWLDTFGNRDKPWASTGKRPASAEN
jgi:AcrR family transcriptional regulator